MDCNTLQCILSTVSTTLNVRFAVHFVVIHHNIVDCKEIHFTSLQYVAKQCILSMSTQLCPVSALQPLLCSGLQWNTLHFTSIGGNATCVQYTFVKYSALRRAAVYRLSKPANIQPTDSEGIPAKAEWLISHIIWYIMHFYVFEHEVEWLGLTYICVPSCIWT